MSESELKTEQIYNIPCTLFLFSPLNTNFIITDCGPSVCVAFFLMKSDICLSFAFVFFFVCVFHNDIFDTIIVAALFPLFILTLEEL